MYGPRYAAVFSVQATRKKSSNEDKVFVVISEKNIYICIHYYMNVLCI